MPPRKYTRSSSSDSDSFIQPKKTSPNRYSSESEDSPIQLKKTIKSSTKQAVKSSPNRYSSDSPIQSKKTIKSSTKQTVKSPPNRYSSDSSDSPIQLKKTMKSSTKQTVKSSPKSSDSSPSEIKRPVTVKTPKYPSEKKTSIEKIPTVLLSKITEFLTYDDRKSIALVNKAFRKVNRETLLDLSSIPLEYTKIVNFLQNNLDIKVVGLDVKVTNKIRDLSGLKPFVKNLKFFNIEKSDFYSKAVTYDFSFLMECKKLETCSINVDGKILPYLVNSHGLKRLYFSGSEEDEDEFKFDFPKLEFLFVKRASKTTLNLKKCPSLLSLNIIDSNFTAVKLLSNNKITDLYLSITGNLDLSFLSKCNKVNLLMTDGGDIDLGLFYNMNLLRSLGIRDPNSIKGDFSRFKSVIYLELFYIINDANAVKLLELPQMPPNLEHFKFYILNHLQPNKLYLKVLQSCPKLEKLDITAGKLDLDVKDISSCTQLKCLRLFTENRFIDHLEQINNFLLLTNLYLRSYNDTLPLKGSKLTQLKSLFVNMGQLKIIDFVRGCTQLEFLYIKSSSRDVDIKPLGTCVSLKTIILEINSMKNYKYLIKLSNLVNLYLYGVKSLDIEQLDDKLKEWDTDEMIGLKEEDSDAFNYQHEHTIMDTPE